MVCPYGSFHHGSLFINGITFYHIFMVVSSCKLARHECYTLTSALIVLSNNDQGVLERFHMA